jgi:hypothetical protein
LLVGGHRALRLLRFWLLGFPVTLLLSLRHSFLPSRWLHSGFDRATVFGGLPQGFAGAVQGRIDSVTDGTTAQELRKILLMALECLNSGKINKATADRISDAANFAVSAIRSAPKHEPSSEAYAAVEATGCR